MNKIKEIMLHYKALGLSIIPIKHRDKIPLVAWKSYQERMATEAEIDSWCRQFPDMNIGIVTGAISGIAVVDIEKGGDASGFPATVSAKTGGGGWHLYYKYPPGGIKNAVRKLNLTDIRGNAGYVVAPWSVHASGESYVWGIEFSREALADFPNHLFETEKSKTDWEQLLHGLTFEGTRNEIAAKVIGKNIYNVSPVKWPEILESIKEWNENNLRPPLIEKELLGVWKSITGRETKRQEKENGTAKIEEEKMNLLKLITDQSVIFKDELDEPHINVPVGDHRETWSIKSKLLKRWIRGLDHMASGKIRSADMIKNIIELLESKGQFESETYRLNNRVAFKDDTLHYDLSNENWEIVTITKDGWNISKDTILFRRFKHQDKQVIPASGGNIADILEFINIKDESDKILFLVYLVSCFIPNFPHPILTLFGSQGSAKSSTGRIIRMIIDPSRTSLNSLPKHQSDFVQLFSHNWYVSFDNISTITNEISDMLCKAVSGDGFSKRELYTDDEDIIYNFQRPFSLNGINLVSKKPDLLERSILIELDRINEENRLPEETLKKKLAEKLPSILGAIFDALSKTLAIKPTIELKAYPRMADFVLWGCAISEALGIEQNAFLDAYWKNVRRHNEEILTEDSVALAIRKFMEDKDNWSGKPSELYETLTRENNTSAEWPKAVNTLSKRINEVKVSLKEDGISVETTKGRDRAITITKKSKDARDS